LIHVNGMGWFGAMTAFALHRDRTEFTWDDTESAYQAWKASTGFVYPSGDPRSEHERGAWVRWVLNGDGPLGPEVADYACLAQWAWSHKRPPHGGKHPFAAAPSVPGLKLSAATAVAVNVQRVVEEARRRFEPQRIGHVPQDVPVVVARPNALTTNGTVWGWSRRVLLRFPAGVTNAQQPPGRRIALYGKVHRFALTYAYPVAGEPGLWWAGSSLVNEQYPYTRSELQLQDAYLRWRTDFAALFPGVKIVGTDPEILQGWRPKPHTGSEGRIIRTENQIIYPALWHSGVRWAPSLVEEVAQWARMRTLLST
jgi:hypothetical protein